MYTIKMVLLQKLETSLLNTILKDFEVWAEAYVQSKESSSEKEFFPTTKKRAHYKNELIKKFKTTE